MDLHTLLNDKQEEAARCTEGPVLILAGAGSGKTRVLTYRIAYLIEEKGVDPFHIMAITFTNKAAGEMRERVNKVVGMGAEAVWVSTFHSACCRILRRYIERIGYGTNFSIYDTDDSKKLVKTIITEQNLDIKKYPPKRCLSYISGNKNKMIKAEDARSDAANFEEEKLAEIYAEYEIQMKKNNALDFDDLLIKAVELFQKAPEVLSAYQERLRYIMVDEYQDTNHIQFEFIRLLSAKYKNICVVGDDDQSIYKFRGADIRNILDFERNYPGAKVVKLEQNYRSTGNILNGANSVIRNNTERTDKTLWTAQGEGEKINFTLYDNAYTEAAEIIREIAREKRRVKCSYSDFAVLYRTNAQSRIIEEQLVLNNMPYRVIGGVNFYARKEIKDILAYLKAVDNTEDDLSVRRIINVPRRGIGDRSIEKIQSLADQKDISFYEALPLCQTLPGFGRTAGKITDFYDFLRRVKEMERENTVSDVIRSVITECGYRQELVEENTDESKDRLENLNELISKAAAYDETAEEPSLSGFLQEVSLVADIDEDTADDRILLMTLHSSKGLEFDHVTISGLEEGLFPGFSVLFEADDSQMQEERRLFYVGMTRAKKTLRLTAARSRMVNGETLVHNTSSFIREIEPSVVEFKNQSGASDRGGFGTSPSYGRKFDREDSGGNSYGFGRVSDRTQRGGDLASSAVNRGAKTSGQGYNFGIGSGYTNYNKRASGTAPMKPSDCKVKKLTELSYEAGDRVRHKKFGDGVVQSIADGARDMEVTVAFDSFGVKKMYASFAKLEKI